MLSVDHPQDHAPILGTVQQLDPAVESRRNVLKMGFISLISLSVLASYFKYEIDRDADIDGYDEKFRAEAKSIALELEELSRAAIQEGDVLLKESESLGYEVFQERCRAFEIKLSHPILRLMEPLLILESMRREQMEKNAVFVSSGKDAANQERAFRIERERTRSELPPALADYSVNEIETETNFIEHMRRTGATVSEHGESALRPGFLGVMRKGLSGQERITQFQRYQDDLQRLGDELSDRGLHMRKELDEGHGKKVF